MNLSWSIHIWLGISFIDAKHIHAPDRGPVAMTMTTWATEHIVANQHRAIRCSCQHLYENATLFLSFFYACPEPVLANIRGFSTTKRQKYVSAPPRELRSGCWLRARPRLTLSMRPQPYPWLAGVSLQRLISSLFPLAAI